MPNFVFWRSFAPLLWTVPDKHKGLSWGTSFVFSWLARRVPDNYLLNEHKKPHLLYVRQVEHVHGVCSISHSSEW